ncbi:18464_t:CDS:2, partial [Dentiscutata erythropus]
HELREFGFVHLTKYTTYHASRVKAFLSFACLSCLHNKVNSETTLTAFQSEEMARDTKLLW